MKTPVISIANKQFVSGSPATRFMVRGVALSANGTQPTDLGITDILANQHHDLMVNTIIPQLTYLNVNCIRVYQVYTDNRHDLSMKSLADAGIYVMIGLATPDNCINRMTGDYSQATFNRAAAIVDEFQAYDNTFCFSVGNEVEFPGEQAADLKKDHPGDTDAEIVAKTIKLELKVAQAMKSFARDIKHHIKTNSYRSIPVGAAMQDGPQVAWGSNNPIPSQQGIIGTDTIAMYYAGGDADERLDYISINTYRYVTGSPADTAYLGLASEVSTLAVPVFLAEAGALGALPRNWADVNSIYTVPALSEQLSGEMAFQMLEKGAGYGLYTVGNDNTLTVTAKGGAAALSVAYATAAGQTLNPASATPTPPTTPPASVTIPGTPPIVVQLNWPTDLLPVKTTATPNATITVKNYATNLVQVTQLGNVMGTVAAGNGSDPTSGTVKVIAGVALSIQASPNWYAVCGVPAAGVKDGITVATDVSWGPNTVCNIS